MHCEGLGGRSEALEQPKRRARASWRGQEASKRCPSEALGRFCEALGHFGEALGHFGEALGHFGEALGHYGAAKM